VRDLRQKIRSVADAEHFARRRLPRTLVHRIEGGAGQGLTVAANSKVYETVQFRPRAGIWTPLRSLATTVLGHTVSLPVLTAPVTNLRVFHRDGEVGLARAAGDAGTIACIGAFSGYPIEAIAAATTGVLFFQLYFVGGRDAAETLVARVRDAGVAALVVTLDAPMWTRRERLVTERVPDLRPGRRAFLRLTPQVLARPGWGLGFLRDGLRVDAPMALRSDGRPMSMRHASGTSAKHPPTWDDLRWLREQFGGPIVVKGVLTADDARRAVAEGAAAVVVSNHGGNTLDGLPTSLEVLPEIVAAVGDEVEVLVDGGIRRGSDVVKALALGARAVLLGRPFMWANAAAGSAGVSCVFDIFRREIDATLAVLGCTSVTELDESYVRVPAEWREQAFDGGFAVD